MEEGRGREGEREEEIVRDRGKERERETGRGEIEKRETGGRGGRDREGDLESAREGRVNKM